MRRPLFAAGVAAAVIAAVWLGTGGTSRPSGRSGSACLVPGETVVIAGEVCRKDEKSFSVKSVILYQLNQEAASSQQCISIQENLICETSKPEEVCLGGFVTVKGIFTEFPEASNPGEFDSAAYYRSINICGRLRKAELLSRKDPYFCFQEKLYRLRCFWKERLYGIFREKEAAVMSALLLGDRTDLDSGLKALYQRNGILHILSISSLHITILGMGLYRLLRRSGLPAWTAALVGGLAMVSYGVMTGFGVSACRAVAMYFLRMLAEVTGRTYDMLNSLGAVGIVMLAVNPSYLENSGFLLSFSSILGIGIVYPAFTRLCAGRRTQVLYGESRMRIAARTWKRKIREGMLLSLSITLATMPIQLWFYYEIPVYGVLVNLMVLPFVKPLLLAGFAVLLLPYGRLPVGRLPGGMAGLILSWYETLCGFFDALPCAVWNPGRPDGWQIAIYYALLGGLVWWSGRRRIGENTGKPKSIMIKKVIAAGILCLAVLLLTVRPAAKTRVIFLNVGQGDCSVVRTASGHTFLIDCGSSSRSGVGKYVLLPFLKYYGIRSIDGIFLSHPDEDHVNGALELLELAEENGIFINQLVLPEVRATEREEAFGELIRAAESAYENGRSKVRYLAAGDSWQCGDAAFLCMHPPSGCGGENTNEYSMCIYAVFGSGEPSEFTALFTGDVEGDGEKQLAEMLRYYGIREVTLLKVAHHGARGSTSGEFLEQIKPVAAVISCGKNNPYGHPHEETLKRLAEVEAVVYKTEEAGAVIVEMSEREMKIYGMKNK